MVGGAGGAPARAVQNGWCTCLRILGQWRACAPLRASPLSRLYVTFGAVDTFVDAEERVLQLRPDAPLGSGLLGAAAAAEAELRVRLKEVHHGLKEGEAAAAAERVALGEEGAGAATVSAATVAATAGRRAWGRVQVQGEGP